MVWLIIVYYGSTFKHSSMLSDMSCYCNCDFYLHFSCRTIKSLWKYLERYSVDVDLLWQRLVDLAVKTVISGESSINQLTRAHVNSRYCCYEIFGLDVLLDQDLRPWLLEVCCTVFCCSPCCFVFFSF